MKQKRLFVKAGLLAIVFVSAIFISWELYLRSQGRGLAYDDGGSLWSDKRKLVYEPSDKATVFIGSSRIKYDLDIPTWQNITGDHAIQLANVGSSPRLILDNLAEDKNFKGKLVIDLPNFYFLHRRLISIKRLRKILRIINKKRLHKNSVLRSIMRWSQNCISSIKRNIR